MYPHQAFKERRFIPISQILPVFFFFFYIPYIDEFGSAKPLSLFLSLSPVRSVLQRSSWDSGISIRADRSADLSSGQITKFGSMLHHGSIHAVQTSRVRFGIASFYCASAGNVREGQGNDIFSSPLYFHFLLPGNLLRRGVFHSPASLSALSFPTPPPSPARPRRDSPRYDAVSPPSSLGENPSII